MMRTAFSTLFFVGCCLSAADAQITVTNSIFPTAGTMLEISTMTSNLSAYPVSAASSAPQTWDFSQLGTDTYRDEEILAASSGAAFADFPTSDVRQTLIPGFGGTAYVDVTATKVEIIGGGIDFSGFAFVSPFSNPLQLQTAPLNYNSMFNDNYQVSFGTHIDSIPFLRQLLDSLASGILPNGVSPDSIRLKINGTRSTRVDAFGTLIAHDSTYEVLRQKVRQTLNFSVEVRIYVPPFPAYWLDITPFLTSAIPLPVPTNDTLVYYDYLTNNYQQPIVRQNMNSDETVLESIEFKGQHTPNAVTTVWNQAAPLRLYPNPAASILTVETGEFASKDCQVQIIDAAGRVRDNQSLRLDSQLVLPVHELPAGNYFLVLRSLNGAERLIRTEPFAVQGR